jgi:hypothetical protein
MKHKAFTEIVAHSCRVPQKTVALFARNLKEAGLLTSGARGVNAPEMTVLDLTRMVISLCATDRPSEATGLTNRYCIAECPEDVTITLGDGEVNFKKGWTLEDILSGVLMVDAITLMRLHPELTINWNNRTATLCLNGHNIHFKAADLSTDEDDGRGIITTRGIGGTDFAEMALPFYLEREDGTSWEEMTASGTAAKVASRHIFGVKDEANSNE